MRYIYVFLFFCLFSNTVKSQEFAVKKNHLTDSIAIPDSDITFAMYLPGSFDINTSSPVLFVFDPYESASLAIRNFRLVSSEFGMPIVALNHPMSQLKEENLTLFAALYKQVFSILPETNEIYYAGFSSAAALATTIGSRLGNSAGLILCGANYGVIEKMNYLRNRDMPVIGLVGDEDFTYHSMQSVHRYLTRKKVANDLILFKGGHYWPTADYLQQALQWIYVKRAIIGKYPQHEIVTPKLYQKHYDYAQSLIDSKNLYFGEKALSRTEKNYRSLFKTDSLISKLENLRRDKDFRRFKRGENGAGFGENDILNSFSTLLEEDIKNASFQNFPFWEDELVQFKSYEKGTIYFQKKLKRIKGMLFHTCAESVPLYDEEEGIDNLIFIYEFMVYIKPGYHKAYLELIQLYTKVGEVDNALSSMEVLFKNGYKDEDALKLLPGVSTLKSQPEFWEILDTYPLPEDKKDQ
ncbi:hypothetical protein [Spongiivirga citrea]|uniref:Alpha/beta hydrolase n=1 Tax=Spongiivirga citrea TaxID=1481457 RepID=A0A6M0CKZ1_9FLAO|nr:hypothetical protein [Spongiivirga citrea]NER18578.1 hypothetical protein [Spongiivirga citrea]